MSPAYRKINKSFLTVAEAALDDHLQAHLSTAELPADPQFACMVGDLDHMELSFKQSN